MRFHRIKLVNINSLYGETEIDFDEGLAQAGLFLIHGPTGAGKTTIFDAICLALFGLTPRLTDRAGRNVATLQGLPPTAPEHVMSRGTGECSVELELSVRGLDGEVHRWRASWLARRARSKADGKFQSVTRTLQRQEPDGTWVARVASDKEKDYGQPFREMLQSLKFEDFQRTTILAQFAFREFLDADETERARLLSRMTDGERFREIGRKSRELTAIMQARAAELQGAMGGKTLLGEDALQALQEELAGLDQERAGLEQEALDLERRQKFWEALGEALAQLAAAEARSANARLAMDEAAPELEALAADERLEPARALLAQVTAAEREHQESLARQSSVQAEVGRLQEARDVAALRQAQTQGARDAASRALADAEPALAKAREAWGALGQTREAHALAQRAVTERLAHLSAARDSVHLAAEGERAAREAHASLRAQRDAIPHAEALARTLESLKTRFEHIALGRDDWKKRDDVRRQRAERLQVLAEAMAQGESEAARLDARLEGVAGGMGEAEQRLAALTEGRDVQTCADELVRIRHAVTEKLGTLERLAEHATRLGAARARQAELLREREALQALRHAQDTALAALRQALPAVEANVVAQTSRMELLGRLLDLVDKREVLALGEACPLCGSPEHPYVHDPQTAPDVSHYREERAACERALTTAVHERDRALRAERDADRAATQTATRLQQYAPQLAALDADIAALATMVQALAGTCGLEEAAGPEAWRALGEQLAGEQTSAEARRQALVAASQAFQSAQQEHARLVEERGKWREVALRHVAERDTLQGALAEDQKELDTLQTRLIASQDELCAAFGELEIPTTDLPAAMRIARERLEEATRLDAALADHREKLERASRDLQAARQSVQMHEEERARAANAVQETEERLAAAAHESARHFEGRDPEDVRRALTEAQQVAIAHDDAARAQLQAAQEKLAAALSQLAVLAENAEKAQEKRGVVVERLAEICAALELEGPEAILAGSLDPARRTALQERRQALVSQMETARTLEEAARAAHAAREQARPEGEEGEAGVAQERRAALAEALEGRRARLQALAERKGELVGRLRQHEENVQAYASLHAEWEEARSEHEQCKAISDLIGTNDGEGFDKIVQAFHLGRLIQLANDRLQRFMPRYALEQVCHEDGMPRLDFRVRDRFQQDELRVIGSLSGGESFVISLGLALALADMRASRLRIETLLIDEGFGSLDQQTLQTVMDALESLQSSSGVRIGVISHVEGLRERIPAQIAVVRSSGGRSVVQVNGELATRARTQDAGRSRAAVE